MTRQCSRIVAFRCSCHFENAATRFRLIVLNFFYIFVDLFGQSISFYLTAPFAFSIWCRLLLGGNSTIPPADSMTRRSSFQEGVRLGVRKKDLPCSREKKKRKTRRQQTKIKRQLKDLLFVHKQLGLGRSPAAAEDKSRRRGRGKRTMLIGYQLGDV
jgi:hypothetical protein